MIIANPIYDVVFKRLMEHDRAAKFFLSTLLGQKVESLELKPQEFTHEDKDILIGLRLFRLDFMAIIKTNEGETKKILIEVQKAKEPTDLMRFRNYLAEQYKKQEIIQNKKTTLPITTIYILGFTLPEVKTACVHVERQYRDMINQSILEEKNEFREDEENKLPQMKPLFFLYVWLNLTRILIVFKENLVKHIRKRTIQTGRLFFSSSLIECLTHDSYVVQVHRITDRYKTRLDKLLSVFEQKNFIGDSEIIKEYIHETDDEDVKIIADILHHVGTDPVTKKEIENEQEAHRTFNERLEGMEKKNLQTIEEQAEALAKKDKALTEKDKKLEEQRKLIEELLRQQKNNTDQ